MDDPRGHFERLRSGQSSTAEAEGRDHLGMAAELALRYWPDDRGIGSESDRGVAGKGDSGAYCAQGFKEAATRLLVGLC